MSLIHLNTFIFNINIYNFTSIRDIYRGNLLGRHPEFPTVPVRNCLEGLEMIHDDFP